MQPEPGDVLSLFPDNSSVDAHGELHVDGVGVVQLAEEFGTPVYVVDETAMRSQARQFVDGLADRWPNSEVLFASKALPILAAYGLFAAEGLSIDVAGGGELVMARAADVPAERIYQHGNAETDAELRMALDAGVGTIILDNFDDIDRLEDLATLTQAVLLRVIPDVAPETHASQSTGGAGSKFGLPLDQARVAIDRLSRSKRLRLDGLHLHVGSQILDVDPFARAVEAVAQLGAFPVYDIGGGLGVRYTYNEGPPTIAHYLDTITDAARAFLPADARLLIEPGRALVGRSCITLYRATTVKATGRIFVAVDGGMGDNLEVSLTGQRLEAAVATRMNDTPDVEVDLVGRHCESGDRLVSGVYLARPRIGDLIAVPVTGAYTYTLANNYNGALRPPIVFCARGSARLMAQRESYEHLMALHCPAVNIAW